MAVWGRLRGSAEKKWFPAEKQRSRGGDWGRAEGGQRSWDGGQCPVGGVVDAVGLDRGRRLPRNPADVRSTVGTSPTASAVGQGVEGKEPQMGRQSLGVGCVVEGGNGSRGAAEARSGTWKYSRWGAEVRD